MKRGKVFSILGLMLLGAILIVSFFGFVSAQSDFFEKAKTSITSAVDTLFKDLLSQYQSGQDVFYMKVLLFILIFVMVQTGVKAIPRLGSQKAVVIIVSFVVSVLGVKWMSDELVKTVLLPYGGLAVALATLFPFLIFFYFVHATKMTGSGRKLAWGFFVLAFVLVAVNRWTEIGQKWSGQYFYFAIGGLIVLAVVFDKGIHRYFFTHELNLFYRGAKGKAIAALQAEYMNIVHVDSPEAEKRRKDIEENLKRLGGNLP